MKDSNQPSPAPSQLLLPTPPAPPGMSLSVVCLTPLGSIKLSPVLPGCVSSVAAHSAQNAICNAGAVVHSAGEQVRTCREAAWCPGAVFHSTERCQEGKNAPEAVN